MRFTKNTDTSLTSHQSVTSVSTRPDCRAPPSKLIFFHFEKCEVWL